MRERDPFSCVSMLSGRVKKQMESDQRKKAVWRNRRRAEEGQEREWRVRHREVKKSRIVRKEQATGKGRTRARAESMRTSRIRVHESA